MHKGVDTSQKLPLTGAILLHSELCRSHNATLYVITHAHV